jgi:DNA repair photolyase
LLGVVVEHERRRGRGSQSNASGRYESLARVAFDDGWRTLDELPPFKTTVTVDSTRKIISRNDSPDIGFDRSINPYRGCEHGCIYCFARPTHAYLGLSPGLDFESKLLVKPEAANLLEKESSAAGYEPKVIAIGTNTDPYQPIDRRYKVMRRILEVLDRAGHPVGIVTKSALVLRDLDILARMAERNLAKVALSVTTLDATLARKMEPRAATPMRRLETLRRLAQAGVPTTVMVAPVIPALNDMEIERILEAARTAGAKEAGYVLLRLPLEVRDLFREWLIANYPDRYRHVFKLIRDMRGGKDYDSTWGTRMKGTGPYAWMIGRRFEMACEKLGLNVSRTQLTTEHFASRTRHGTAEFYSDHERAFGILSLVTLGVANLKRSIAFYETLGFRRKALAASGVGFSRPGPVRLRSLPSDELERRQHCVRRNGRKFSRYRAGLNCRDLSTTSMSWSDAPARRGR